MKVAYFSCIILTFLCINISRADGDGSYRNPEVFVEGAALSGGVNGMYFDAFNKLLVAQVYGFTISTIDPESGAVVNQLTFDDGVAFADDVRVDSDRTLYWTDAFYFSTVMSRTLSGETNPVLPPGSVPFANSIALSDDETQLFYGQCWNPAPENGVYQHNLATNTTMTLVDSIPGCASNAMEYFNGSLFTPRPFEGRIVRIDLEANNTVVNVTDNWGGTPNALKFDSQGNLYAANSALGQIVRIDLGGSDTDDNRVVIGEFPSGSIDNLALDKDDRIFVSSQSDGEVVELLDDGSKRVVSPGLFSITMGVAVLNQTLFTVHPGAVFGFDLTTKDRTVAIRAVPGGLRDPTSVVAWNNNLILLSFPFSTLTVFDPVTEMPVSVASFEEPIDALPFQGDLLVTELGSGQVVRASASDLNQHEAIFKTSGPLFLAGDDTNVFLTDVVNKTLYQIIADGEVLASPIVIAAGFDAPEGIAMYGDDSLIVVDAGSQSLKQVDLATGEVEVIATDLGFLPGVPGLPFGFPNDVVVHEGVIYVNADKKNVIYKMNLEQEVVQRSTASLTTTYPLRDLIVLMVSLLFMYR